MSLKYLLMQYLYTPCDSNLPFGVDSFHMLIPVDGWYDHQVWKYQPIFNSAQLYNEHSAQEALELYQDLWMLEALYYNRSSMEVMWWRL